MGPSGTGRWQEIFIRGEPGPLCSTKTSSNHSPLCPGTCVGLFGCSRPIYYTVCSKALFSQSMWDWKWILEQPQVKEHLSCTLSDSEEGKAGTAGTLHPDKIWHSNKPAATELSLGDKIWMSLQEQVSLKDNTYNLPQHSWIVSCWERQKEQTDRCEWAFKNCSGVGSALCSSCKWGCEGTSSCEIAGLRLNLS